MAEALLQRMSGVVNMARQIPRELRQWRRYADDVSRTPYFRKLGRAAPDETVFDARPGRRPRRFGDLLTLQRPW